MASRCCWTPTTTSMSCRSSLGSGLDDVFVTGGGYKYCQLGEGNCFLRVPPHTGMRPVLTGWFAAFDSLAEVGDRGVPYGPGARAFAGARTTRRRTIGRPRCSTFSRNRDSRRTGSTTSTVIKCDCSRPNSNDSTSPRRSLTSNRCRTSAVAGSWRSVHGGGNQCDAPPAHTRGTLRRARRRAPVRTGAVPARRPTLRRHSRAGRSPVSLGRLFP